MDSISPTDLAGLDDAVIIDVREPQEVATVRIPHATSIPLSTLLDRIDEVPDDAYIICHAGGRSARVVQYLEAQGRHVTDVTGGMDAWEAAGLPVERD